MLDTHARKYVQPVIQGTARGCIRLGFNANQITWAAFITGVAAGGLTATANPVMGVILLWISGYLDAVDGSMAREQGRSSAWGTLLDVTFDRIVELGIIIALAVRYPHARLLLLLLTAGMVFSMTVFLTVGALADKKGMKSFYYQAGLAERTEGFIFLSLMMVLPHWLLWSAGVFMAMEVMTGFQRMAEARRLFA